MYLGEGLAQGAGQDEVDRAKNVIEKKTDYVLVKKSDFKALQAAGKQGRRRGPKPIASTNQTDEEETQRLDEIRRLLKFKEYRLTKIPLLGVVLGLLRTFRVRCEEGLFVGSKEQAAIHVLFRQPPEVIAGWIEEITSGSFTLNRPALVHLPHPHDLLDWFHEFKECCTARTMKRSWKTSVSEMVNAFKGPPQQHATLEKDLYRQIKEVLDLERSNGTTFCLDPMCEEAASEPSEKLQTEPSATRSPRRQGASASVPETLKAATARLVLLRHIIDDCEYIPSSFAIESLYLLVRSLSWGNPVGSLPPVVQTLDSVFLAIIHRQLTHPFPVIANEEVDLGPTIIPEDGQIEWA